ncbi:methyltransferase [Geojedonia litorea]|uniref:Methyltransferase n=1 Tax=Geojedonia litorea TaxID=1268269 RepID=A0ABV9N3C9_9FLAO
MKTFLKKISTPFMQWWFKTYYSKPRSYSYNNINLTIHPGVFPPKYTFSTKILLKHLETLDLKSKTLLELGCGSGIISLIANKKGAIVTSSDINGNALNQLEKSANKNSLKLHILKSDLFNKITKIHFDYIIINPPYYPKKPKSIDESAWYCGENYEYFVNLFQQLPCYVKSKSYVLMILSENCDIEKIQTIAHSNNLDLKIIKMNTNFWETNYLFEIIEK